MKIDYFFPERPRLMAVDQSLFDRLSQDKNWVAEPKINGSHLLLYHLPNGEWQFWSRHGERLKYQPNTEVLKALNNLNLQGYWLFDGENRHNKVVGIQNKLALYDVFIKEGKLLLGIPFRDRREILERFIFEEHPCPYPVVLLRQYQSGFKEVFQRLIQFPEIEGLVIKHLDGKLNLSRKSGINSAWMWKVRKPTKNYQI